MEISVKFYSQTFVSETQKDAYLKACRWIAKNVISDDKLSAMSTWRVIKIDDAEQPTVVLDLYCTYNESVLISSFCKSCKEFHSSFYINQQQNCNCCNMQAYRTQISDVAKNKKTYAKELLNKLE